MTHNDDLALVTACRDRLTDFAGVTYHVTVTVTSAALSLIEDTLNDHAPDRTDPNFCQTCGTGWECVTHRNHVAALHTIATTLGANGA